MNSAENPPIDCTDYEGEFRKDFDNVFTCGKNKQLHRLVQLKNSELTAPCGLHGRKES